MYITIQRMAQKTGLSRKYITHLIDFENAPCLPRKKGQTYRLDEDAWEKYLKETVYANQR